MEASFQTHSGKIVDLLNMTEDDIDLYDVAHHLAMQCRYNGATKEFYSVAEHSVLMTTWADNQGMSLPALKAILLHDAAETYIGDMVYHLKQRFPEFIKLDNKISNLIYLKFGVDPEFARLVVSDIDRRICIDEMSQLCASVDPALVGTPIGVETKAWHPGYARLMYLSWANKLNLITLGENEL